MQFATGALGTLIPKLGMLLKEEYDLQKRVKGGIKFLMAELESMQAALEKVSRVPEDQLDNGVILWARDVREMSYDIEDSVDTFLVRVEGRKYTKKHDISGFVDLCHNMLSKARIQADRVLKVKIRRRIAVDIKDIMGRVKEAKERRDKYNVDNVPVNPVASSIDPRLAALYKKATELVGVNETSDKVMQMLSEGDGPSKKKLMGVSICGFGGLGKTTLAKVVWEKLKVEFNCYAFVSVGQNPDIKKTFKDILLELDKISFDNIHNTIRDEKQLIDLLREFLESKRYIIVIDDIWDINSWEAIKLAFIENNNGSRIITTTRKFEVAKETGDVYNLVPLSCDNSKKLFYTRIFGGDGKCPDNQSDDVPDKILKKCGGVPLAIVTIASLLAGKPTEEWFKVYSSIHFNHKDNRHVENTMKILSYSYYDLPYHLRTCLLYLSVYPEDYTIDKDLLIWKWIAEGFVTCERELTLFEVGERYFNDLKNRSLIQPVNTDIWHLYQKEEGYRLHDMVHSLICSLSCKDNFVAIVNAERGTSEQSNNVRRYAFQSRNMEHNHQTDKEMTHVRSYIAFSCWSHKTLLLSSFHVLRVLALEMCIFMEGYHLTQIGDLPHLRYLGLYGTPICELPKEIVNLKFLQTLDLLQTRIKKLPSSIGFLRQLMCLKCMLTSEAPVDGATIAKLTSLEELWIYPAAADDDNFAEKFLTGLGNLMELRVLATYIPAVLDQRLGEAMLQSLGKMAKLRSLFIAFKQSRDPLIWEATHFSPSRYLQYLALKGFVFSSLPAWINSARLPNLCHLDITVQSLDSWGMISLGMLPELSILNLSTRTAPDTVYHGGGSCFNKLRCCFYSWNAMFVRNKSGAPILPNLEYLNFNIDVCRIKKICADFGQDISSFLPTLIALDSIPSLTKVHINIECCNATSREIEETEAALNNIIDTHPNRPISVMGRWDEGGMITPSPQQQSTTENCKVFNFNVHVQKLNNVCYPFDFKNLGNLPSLEIVNAHINCEGATPDEVEVAETGLRQATLIHPNKPKLVMERYGEENMTETCSNYPSASEEAGSSQQ